MFENAKSFNRSLDKWNVSNVCFMDYMFKDASRFNIYPKSWIVPKNSIYMFLGTKVEKIAEKTPLEIEDNCEDEEYEEEEYEE